MGCWIPEARSWADTSGGWAAYDSWILGVLKRDFMDDRPIFRGKPVRLRVKPEHKGRPEGFWHLTSAKMQGMVGEELDTPWGRSLDFKRCERIEWPRAFIEHAGDCSCSPDLCSGVMVWDTVTRGGPSGVKRKTKLFLEERSYLVVLEDRNSYWVLITAFVAEGGSLSSIKREMARCGAKKAGNAV